MKYWIFKPRPEFRLADWLRESSWLSDDRLADVWERESSDGQPEAGDYIFFWYEDTLETSGIVAEGKVTTLPGESPLTGRKQGYYKDKNKTRKANGVQQTAVQYIRLCLAQPVTAKDLEEGEATRTISLSQKQQERALEIPEAAGKYIEVLLRSRTTLIDLTYCQNG